MGGIILAVHLTTSTPLSACTNYLAIVWIKMAVLNGSCPSRRSLCLLRRSPGILWAGSSLACTLPRLPPLSFCAEAVRVWLGHARIRPVHPPRGRLPRWHHPRRPSATTGAGVHHRSVACMTVPPPLFFPQLAGLVLPDCAEPQSRPPHPCLPLLPPVPPSVAQADRSAPATELHAVRRPPAPSPAGCATRHITATTFPCFLAYFRSPTPPIHPSRWCPAWATPSALCCSP